MSRDIKFRAWDDCAEKMIIAGFDDGYTFIKSECGFDVYGDDGMNIYHLELMQYTGIKDKNGTEIYEDDIVVVTESGTNGFSSRHKVVNWTHENYPAFDLYPPVYDELNSFSAISSLGDHTVEVIGNIYENPELQEVE